MENVCDELRNNADIRNEVCSILQYISDSLAETGDAGYVALTPEGVNGLIAILLKCKTDLEKITL